jgi:hypothetical protein
MRSLPMNLTFAPLGLANAADRCKPILVLNTKQDNSHQGSRTASEELNDLLKMDAVPVG